MPSGRLTTPSDETLPDGALATDALVAPDAAVVWLEDEEPEPERRGKKDGDSESGIVQLARKVARQFTARSPRGPAAAAGDVRENFHT